MAQRRPGINALASVSNAPCNAFLLFSTPFSTRCSRCTSLDLSGVGQRAIFRRFSIAIHAPNASRVVPVRMRAQQCDCKLHSHSAPFRNDSARRGKGTRRVAHTCEGGITLPKSPTNNLPAEGPCCRNYRNKINNRARAREKPAVIKTRTEPKDHCFLCALSEPLIICARHRAERF